MPDDEAFIGTEFPPTADLEYKGGILLTQNPEYFIELFSRDGQLSIRFSSGKLITDVVVLPALNRNEIILTEYCQINGGVDPFIFSIAELDLESFSNRYVKNSRIRYAWRADPVTGKIQPIPVEGIECAGEGGFDPNNVIYEFSKLSN